MKAKTLDRRAHDAKGPPHWHAFWCLTNPGSLLITAANDDERGGRASFLSPTTINFRNIRDARYERGRRTLAPRDRNSRASPHLCDYDVDAPRTPSTATPETSGANAGFHIPHRFMKVYGIQQPALERAAPRLQTRRQHRLRHSRSRTTYWARDHGLDVIITDHICRMKKKAHRRPLRCSIQIRPVASIG